MLSAVLCHDVDQRQAKYVVHVAIAVILLTWGRRGALNFAEWLIFNIGVLCCLQAASWLALS